MMIWVFLALLAVLLLMFLLVPVWYRRPVEMKDQSEENLRLYQERSDELAASEMDNVQKQALQLELDREFLAAAALTAPATASASVHKRWPLALALLVAALLATVLLYQQWGAGTQLQATRLLQKAAEAGLSDTERTELLNLLQVSSARDPGNTEWAYLYGRLSLNSGDYEQAAATFTDLLLVLPEEAREDRAGLLSLLAQARFFAADQRPDEAMYGLMQESLTLVPQQPQTRGLAGMMAFELGRYRDAILHWQLLWQSLPDTPETAVLVQGIERAAERLREQGETVDLSFLQRAQLKVRVEVADAVRAALDPATPVFVLARNPDGPPMPLAAHKLTLAQLPQVVILSDAQAMMPGLNLSSTPVVEVLARISLSGQPTAQSGDWQSELKQVSNRHEGVLTLRIEKQVP